MTREEVKLWRKSTAGFKSLEAVKSCYDTLCLQFIALLDERDRLKSQLATVRENLQQNCRRVLREALEMASRAKARGFGLPRPGRTIREVGLVVPLYRS